MNEKIKEILKKAGNVKLIMFLGIAGIVLIFISSVIPSGKSDKNTSAAQTFSSEQYAEQMQKEVEVLVKQITGAKNVKAVVTLDTGISYNYADEVKSSADAKHGERTEETSRATEQKKTVITDSDGNEKAIVINEFLPTVRGVAVVYDGVGDDKTNALIESAVKAALSVTSKQIFIYGNGGQNNEKR